LKNPSAHHNLNEDRERFQTRNVMILEMTPIIRSTLTTSELGHLSLLYKTRANTRGNDYAVHSKGQLPLWLSLPITKS